MFKLAVNVVSVCLQVKMTKNLISNRRFIIWHKTDLIFERFEL